MEWYAGAAVCLAVALVAMVGCEEKASKKRALTDNEIRRRTLAVERDRPDRLVVCGQTITWEDVLASLPEDSPTAAPLKERLEIAAQEMSQPQFLEEARPVIQRRLRSRISSLVLAQRAERDLGKGKFEEKVDELAEKELRRFIFEEHGGNGAEADEALQKAGYNRNTYKQWKKKEGLAKYLVDSRYSRNRPVTYGELQERYEGMKSEGKFVREGVIQWRLIEIHVDKTGVKYPNEDAAVKARRLTDELRKRIEAGEDFAELAKECSDGLYSEDGGLWPARGPNASAPPYDVLAKQTLTMERGQVAGPIEVPGRFFLLKVEEKQPRSYQPLNEVQEEVRKDVTEGRWREVYDELDAEIRQQVDETHAEQFVDYCLEGVYRRVHPAN